MVIGLRHLSNQIMLAFESLRQYHYFFETFQIAGYHAWAAAGQGDVPTPHFRAHPPGFR